jgi:hypothetical protein
MSNLSIIIPHRGNALGLWATIHSCDIDLAKSKLSYNYVIVTNGEKLSADSKGTLRQLEKSGLLLKHIHHEQPLTPPAARQVGSEVADGELLFFFDNHCLVAPGYFDRAKAVFERMPAVDMLHSTTCFYSNDGLHYHYKLKLDYNFWAESSKIAQDEVRPYRIAAGGHGGFAIRKSVWDEVGGYGPDNLFDGYGGEELAFDLKLWLLGKEVYLDPKMIHYHYTGFRGYSRHYTDDYYRNLLASAHVVGGEKWLYRVFESFIKPGQHLRIGPKKNMYDLLIEAYERSAEYAHELRSKSVRSLDELLLKFRLESVAM